MMRYSSRFEADWCFYNANRHKFTFCGKLIPMPMYSKTGKPAKYAFYIFDSTGKIISTTEPQLLRDILICKAAINMQLKQWAEGFNDCSISQEHYLSEFTSPIPEWVYKSLHNQITKYALT